MQRIFMWVLVGVLLTASGQDLVCQTVKLLADVDVSWPFPLFPYFTKATDDGRYLACANDTIGVIRLQTYPLERRDTVAIPDSVKTVRCVGFVSGRLLLTYESRSNGSAHFATIDINGKEWTSIPDVVPTVHPEYGPLYRIQQYTAAPGQNTAVLGIYYRSGTTLSTTRYITTFINTQTLATLQTYDSLGTMKVCPGGREYYCTKLAPDSSAWLCQYFDAATGDLLRTVRCRGQYYYSTGIDHVMYTDREIGSIEEPPVTVLSDYQVFNGTLAAPNLFCRLRTTGNVKWLEAYDFLNGSATLIDSLHANGVIVQINDVDRLIFVQTVEPFRFRVYSYSGLQGREGIACIRNVDTTLVFSEVDYSAVHVSRTRNATITSTIDGKQYAMNGRTTPLSLRADRHGVVPFSATARNAQGVVIDSMERAPLVVRRPSAYTDAVRVPQEATELALGENEESLSVVSDSMMTVFPIISGAMPMLDTSHARIIRHGSLHATQSALLPSTSYVKIVLRDDDPGNQEYRRSLDQLVVGFNGDTSLIRSVSLTPEVIVRKVRTVWNVTESVLGLAVFTSNPGPGRLYLSKRIDGAWVSYGDTNGIKIVNGDRIDISVPGLIMTTGTSGALYLSNMSDGSSIFDTTDGRAHALLVDDSTFITTERVWKLRDGTWQAQPILSRHTYYNADAVRLSASTSLLFRQDRDMIGYIVDHSRAAVVDSILYGFSNPQCAVYSKRYRGLFIGNDGGVVGFVPIDPKYLDPTSVSFEQPSKANSCITSCTLYTVQGSKVASLTCSSLLSTTDVESLAKSNGLYIAVYTQEHGKPISQMVFVGR
ncbi:MAG: hypothetical protein JSS89_13870 [Bacteroidetes bacterium]|nr:hypothetical protein [Bacteroidota bacterium]